MNARAQTSSRAGATRGLSLVELMVATALGGLLMTAAVSLWLFGSRSFVAMANYAALDSSSRNAVDLITREVRQATSVTGFQKTAGGRWLKVTNAFTSTETTYSWNKASRTLVAQSTGQSEQICLTQCDSWDFELYQRTPQNGQSYIFFPATNIAGAYDLSICKLINMNWKCGRTIMGAEANTETMQTAQVVLRNKQ